MKSNIYLSLIILITGFLFTSCDVNNEEPPTEPMIEGEIEIGLGNNSMGVIGRDFHFEMEALAGDLLENIQIRIEPRSGEEYSHEWSYEITWDYNGLKNANVHKHFDIPEDAAEGVYDFIITVNDQNGTKLEEVKTITIYLPENLPVDPRLSIFNLQQNAQPFYWDSNFVVEPPVLSKNDTLHVQGTVDGVKGNGIMYLLLINKSLDHRPESVDEIDFSKVIVYDVFEHENEEKVYSFSNVIFDFETFTVIRPYPEFIIGADEDNNAPEPYTIEGDKAWKNGDYYFGIIYKNTSYNQTLFDYIELKIEGF